MKNLATAKWKNKSSGEDRIKWCVDICDDYFNKGGLEKCLAKDARRKKFYNENPDLFVQGPNPQAVAAGHGVQEKEDIKVEQERKQEQNLEEDKTLEDVVQVNLQREEKESDGQQNEGKQVDKLVTSQSPKPIHIDEPKSKRMKMTRKLKLLDVGSCFNPFKSYSQFQTVPIDLHPATRDVWECDFINLNVGDERTTDLKFSHITEKNRITSLPRAHFDIVVFSLLLTYIPCPHERWKMCCKAHQLLDCNGILLIITPDSNCVNKRAHLNKLWRDSIEYIGFQRIHYSKSPHLHHFAFRKVPSDYLWDKRTTKVHPTQKMLNIPQDLR